MARSSKLSQSLHWHGGGFSISAALHELFADKAGISKEKLKSDFSLALALMQEEMSFHKSSLVDLRIYTELGRTSKCHHAMTSLKKSMKWDEDRYGLEYDLDRFMIVAVDDFNAGAMENKGLNIFNAKYILADPQTATDQDYENIESIVGHEYFHNWTGQPKNLPLRNPMSLP